MLATNICMRNPKTQKENIDCTVFYLINHAVQSISKPTLPISIFITSIHACTVHQIQLTHPSLSICSSNFVL